MDMRWLPHPCGLWRAVVTAHLLLLMEAYASLCTKSLASGAPERLVGLRGEGHTQLQSNHLCHHSPKGALRIVRFMHAFKYDHIGTWQIFTQELIDAVAYEEKVWLNAYLAEKLFPRIAG